MNKIIRVFGVFTLLLIVFGACKPRPVYDEVYSLAEEGWPANEPLVFKAAITDTSQPYSVYLHIRNKRTYSYSNIWLFVETTAPNGLSQTDTLEVILADESGRWLGRGIGNVNSMLITYMTGVKFKYRGVYSFEVTQGMREEELEAILDVGLRINKFIPPRK